MTHRYTTSPKTGAVVLRYDMEDDEHALERGKEYEAAQQREEEEDGEFDQETYENALNNPRSKRRRPRAEPKQRSFPIKLKLKLASKRPFRDVAILSNEIESVNVRGDRVTLSACSVNALRIVLSQLFRINAKTDTKFFTFRTTPYGLSRILRLGYDLNLQQIKKLLLEVRHVSFTIDNPARFAYVVAIPDAEIDKKTRIITLRLNDALKRYLLDLDDYRKLDRRALQLGSSERINFYQYMRRFAREGQIRRAKVAFTDLQQVLNAKVPWYEFRRTYLDPALADIKKKRPEMTISYEKKDVKRRGARPDLQRGEVETVTFTVGEHKPKPLLLEHKKS